MCHGRGGLEVNLEGRVGTEGRKALPPVGERMNDQKRNEDGICTYAEASVGDVQAVHFEGQSWA